MMIPPSRSFLILLTLSVQMLTHMEASSSSKVEYLPGFQGPLPFELETGYVGLGETNDDDDMQVFYYFIKSENNPKKDPLMLWLSGGPGCSSISGLIIEMGPIKFEMKDNDESLPSLILRPESWTKLCNIIFVDLPFGTGFSYSKNNSAQRSDWKIVHHAHQFLRKWLIDHPEFISNEFYMGGDSYSGIPVPAIVQEIINGNEKGLQPLINLQRYLLGNPVTTFKEYNYRVSYAHGMGFISDELYASLKRNCKGDYVDVDSRNVFCLRDIESFKECISGINSEYILDPSCRDGMNMWGRSLTQEFKESLSSQSHLKVPQLNCKETIGKWERCYSTDFKHDILSSFEFHVNLSKMGIPSLVYSGDHDLVVPFTSTQAWIRDLNYSIVDDWRPWLVNGQVGGYTRTYSNKMTFATVKGSGHDAPQYTPEQCFAMFTRWVSNLPF
ncbi:hypothetical protein KIW84_076551 [Lathyrus oleraceus]|uniref:Uncharacterized protein n=1 Tax=Pisum sativum TaxID=3888 RepID=A0A9D4VWV6_PEA|nr:hypothetical protein KIW84_076551 [Pisum sativum]